MLHAPLPPLAGLKRVSVTEIYHDAHARTLLDAIRSAGIDCFLDDAGDRWFGPEDADFIEHDRWLYRLSAEEFAKAGYESQDFELVVSCMPGDFKLPRRVFRLDEEVYELATKRQRMLRAANDKSEANLLRLTRNFLIATREFGLHHAPDNAELNWTQDMHDILHHWDEWCVAHNPDGIPQDLVLRMHGLGALNAGKRWRP